MAKANGRRADGPSPTPARQENFERLGALGRAPGPGYEQACEPPADATRSSKTGASELAGVRSWLSSHAGSGAAACARTAPGQRPAGQGRPRCLASSAPLAATYTRPCAQPPDRATRNQTAGARRLAWRQTAGVSLNPGRLLRGSRPEAWQALGGHPGAGHEPAGRQHRQRRAGPPSSATWRSRRRPCSGCVRLPLTFGLALVPVGWATPSAGGGCS